MKAAQKTDWTELPYVLPFAVFLAFLAIQKYFPIPPLLEYTLRDVVLAALLFWLSRHVIELHSFHRLETAILGVAVFLIWVGPDLLFPTYRHFWLFQNAILGQLSSPLPDDIIRNPLVLWPRIIQAVVIVPIIEELFWRSWLMRWLIAPNFEKVSLGSYQPGAFWITAVLFASEHGPYWDVGLVAGIAYNWWMVRTRSLGDCILAHSITNACLCGYIVATHHWEYWQ